MEKLLNKKQVADVLGVKVPAINKWMHEKKIPYVKISPKTVRFIPSEIRKYIAKRKSANPD